jgi:hypothetical protein
VLLPQGFSTLTRKETAVLGVELSIGFYSLSAAS